MERLRLLSRLARPGEAKIVLLVLDGVGDLACGAQPRTALESARTPKAQLLMIAVVSAARPSCAVASDMASSVVAPARVSTLYRLMK